MRELIQTMSCICGLILLVQTFRMPHSPKSITLIVATTYHLYHSTSCVVSLAQPLETILITVEFLEDRLALSPLITKVPNCCILRPQQTHPAKPSVAGLGKVLRTVSDK